MHARLFASVTVMICIVIGLVAAAAGGQRLPASLQRADLVSWDGRDVFQLDQAAGQVKAGADSVYLLGGPGRYDGRFEDASGQPNWQGWTHEDLTVQDCRWQVSTFQAINGQYSAWCGTYFGDDPGYGNGWNQQLVLRHAVTNPGVTSNVHWTAMLRVDTEPGYDYVHLAANLGGVWQDLLVRDGQALIPVDLTVVYHAGDYVGSNSNEIQLRFQFISDLGWSDEDGLWDTDGACQVDDVVVTVNGALVSSEDFEDGAMHDWDCLAPAVGDFAALYVGLQDLDPCFENRSAQVAFIDDGLVVPGTGGSPCTSHCYGPGGYIVNNTGGLVGPEAHIDNILVSPVLAWPEGMVGLELRSGCYLHEQLGDFATWPGVFIRWWVRSTSDPVTRPIEAQPWRTDGWFSFGGPRYFRYHWQLNSLLEPGCVEVQVGLGVIEFGWYWGWVGTDGTPAPYFDNVACVAYAWSKPWIGVSNDGLASDAFPAGGDFDFQDPVRNAVRFDSCVDIAWHPDPRVDFGDSLVYEVKAMRAGAVLDGLPAMHVRMKANPLFDAVRELPPGFVQQGALITGLVEGDSVYIRTQQPPVLVPDRYQFDLPDSGFFFPGDEIRWYVEARDVVAGDVGVALVPADTAGFSDFTDDKRYHIHYRARALPTLHSLTAGDQPTVLFYQDAGGRFEPWQQAFPNLGWERGIDYDWFYTKYYTDDEPNGLGTLATSALLDGYQTLIYSAGSMAPLTHQPQDLQVIDNWFQRGDKNALLVGDGLVTDLVNGDSQAQAFLNNYIGGNYFGGDVSDFIGGQLSPRVRPIPGNGIVARVDEWIVWGGCPTIATMDAIAPVGSTVRIAAFVDPAGNAGGYPYAAGTYHHDQLTNARVVLLPYDFPRVRNAPGWTPPPGYEGIAARTILLEDIMAALGEYHPGQPIAAPAADLLAVRAAPNPFNPRTVIALSLPRGGEVTVKIYSLRGELVRTLVAEPLPAGQHELVWDGATDAGQPVGSGVYFCETRALGEKRVSKLAVVR